MTYDICGLCLLLWTNHLHYLNYWVSLGRFYLLDIHCDYSYISPLCGVAPTPDCGMFVIYLSFISPLCGVAQTPDCGMFVISFVSFRGVIQTLDWPSVLPWDFGRTTARFPFYFPCIAISFSECALLNLFICIMFTFVISYVRTVLRVLS